MIFCDQPPTPAFPVTANTTIRSNNNASNCNNYNTNNRNNNNNWRPSSVPRQGGNSPRPSRPYLGRCQACGVQGNSAQKCPSFRVIANNPMQQNAQQSQWRPFANATYTTNQHSDAWLMDSAASHHVTTDLNNMAAHMPYVGSDGIVVGNGANLPITHTGSLSLQTPSKNFNLNDVRYAPSMQKNLISVNRFCKTNNASVEFFPNMFQVKDLPTGTPVLTAPVNGNLYEWPTNDSHTPLAFSAVSSSSSD